MAQIEHKHSIALVRARALKGESLVHAKVYRNKVLQQLQDRLNVSVSHKHTGSPPPRSPVPPSINVHSPGTSAMPAHTPSTVPTLNLSALQSRRRGGGSSVNSSRSSSTSTRGSGGRRRDGAGDKKILDQNSEAACWSDMSLQSEWSFDPLRLRRDSLSPGKGRTENEFLVIEDGSTIHPLSMKKNGTKGRKPSLSLPPSDLPPGGLARQSNEWASRMPEAGIGGRESIHLHSSKEVPEKDLLSSLYGDMLNLVPSVEEKGSQLVGNLRTHTGEEGAS